MGGMTPDAKTLTPDAAVRTKGKLRPDTGDPVIDAVVGRRQPGARGRERRARRVRPLALDVQGAQDPRPSSARRARSTSATRSASPRAPSPARSTPSSPRAWSSAGRTRPTAARTCSCSRRPARSGSRPRARSTSGYIAPRPRARSPRTQRATLLDLVEPARRRVRRTSSPTERAPTRRFGRS